MTVEDGAAQNQAYNIGHGDETTLAELFDKIRDLVAQRLPHLKNLKPLFREPRKGDLKYSRADIGKAQRLLGYQPELRINEGLQRTIDWYVAHQSWWDKQLWMREIPIITKTGKRELH